MRQFILAGFLSRHGKKNEWQPRKGIHFLRIMLLIAGNSFLLDFLLCLLLCVALNTLEKAQPDSQPTPCVLLELLCYAEQSERLSAFRERGKNESKRQEWKANERESVRRACGTIWNDLKSNKSRFTSKIRAKLCWDLHRTLELLIGLLNAGQ